MGTGGKRFGKNIKVTGTMDAVARAWQDHPQRTEMVEGNSPLRRLMLIPHRVLGSQPGAQRQNPA